MSAHLIVLIVNGYRYSVTVESRQILADVLREQLSLTGTHLGCEQGVCGACTVLIDGRAVRSCLILAVQVHEAEILTVEGLATETGLHSVQQAFWDSHAFQCGFCTPGFVMTAVALLREGRCLSDQDIREELSGNICRCSGYQAIVAGLRLALAREAGDE